MKFLGYEFRKAVKTQPEERSNQYEQFYGSMVYGSYSSFASSKALTLSACYRAVGLISDAIASIQMKTYLIDENGYKQENITDPLYNILGVEPNQFMSRFNFFKLIVTSILLRGNAYIKIHREGKVITGLEFINPDMVTISTISNTIKYKINGTNGLLEAADMIHVLNQPQIGSLYGASTITYAANTLGMSYNSESHAGNYFKGGANAAGFLSSVAPLTPKQEHDLITKFKNASNAETGNPNGIIFMGGAGDIKLQTLGISPRDSQLLETRAFNVVEIGRFFNVNPILLFDSSKGTYSNIENAQLDFLNTTLLPIIEKLENEFSRKLIDTTHHFKTEIRFDLANLLRADKISQADYYTKLFGLGVITANMIAKDLNLPKIEGDGGNKYFISTNLQDSSNLIVNTNNSVDNKIAPTAENSAPVEENSASSKKIIKKQ